MIDGKGKEYVIPLYCINPDSNGEFMKLCNNAKSKQAASGGGETGKITVNFKAL